jgi:predicted PurR-regulated permease PerM
LEDIAGLWTRGLRQAALCGLLAGIFNSIPYYGPLLVTAGLTVVGFLQFGTIGMTIAVAGVSLLITTLEGSLLTPTLMSRVDESDCDLHGAAILELDLGVRGMLLAVPMMMAIKVICDHVEPRLELLELTYQSLMRSVALWSTTARHAIDQERECLG